MSEIERTINFFSRAAINGIEQTRGYMKLAATALCEKQEREKGCKYCNDASIEQHASYVDSGFPIMGVDHYCINCGRKLEESK